MLQFHGEIIIYRFPEPEKLETRIWSGKPEKNQIDLPGEAQGTQKTLMVGSNLWMNIYIISKAGQEK